MAQLEIDITPEIAEGIAGEIEQAATDAKRVVTELRAKLDRLLSVWKGTRATNAAAIAAEAMTKVEQFGTVLNAMAKLIEENAKDFKAFDAGG